ncbi:MAG: peptide chain release factor 1 [Oscillatoriales cyanobacterium]|nr:MAG: peptide chain release factor 1 [Oscillatoriales cyanobacterium]
MSQPWKQLTQQPWSEMAGTAAMALALALAIDYGLVLAAGAWPVVASALMALAQVGVFMLFGVGLGLGALAVYCGERLFPQICLNTGSLWTLVACLGLELGVLGLLPLPILLVKFDQLVVMGAIVGIFWKGRRYWRY